MSAVEKEGFEIIPEVFNRESMTSTIESLDKMPLRHGRAGARNALASRGKGLGSWSVKEGVICAHAPAYALEQVLAIRIHLDHSNEENGSLRVLPQTHTLGVLSDDETHELAKEIPPVDCHVATGGVLLMRPLLVHSSSKAKSETAHRRVLHIEYAARVSFPDGIELCTSEMTSSLRA